MGRALFTRFLGDRGLLAKPLKLSRPSEAASLFDTTARAAETSHWLDETFNGDFLPLSDGLFDRLPSPAFTTLGNILRRAPDGQLRLGWEEKWDNLAACRTEVFGRGPATARRHLMLPEAAGDIRRIVWRPLRSAFFGCLWLREVTNNRASSH